MPSPWYFALLDIEPTDDQRAIKRAYAVQLKRIDQETEAEAFARLRQAYELAQQWQSGGDGVGWGVQEDWREDGAATTSDAEDSPPLSPVVMEQGMAFQARFDAPPLASVAVPILRETGELVQQLVEKIRQAPLSAQALLAEALLAPELESLDARARFEAELAEWLCRFPQGNGELFEAMVRTFDWSHRLPELPWEQARWLDQMMEERARWWVQGDQECALQQQAMLRAASGEMPEWSDDPRRWSHILRHRMLVALWLAPAQLDRWRQWLDWREASSRAAARVRRDSGSTWFSLWWVIILVYVLFPQLIKILSSHGTRSVPVAMSAMPSASGWDCVDTMARSPSLLECKALHDEMKTGRKPGYDRWAPMPLAKTERCIAACIDAGMWPIQPPVAEIEATTVTPASTGSEN